MTVPVSLNAPRRPDRHRYLPATIAAHGLIGSRDFQRLYVALFHWQSTVSAGGETYQCSGGRGCPVWTEPWPISTQRHFRRFRVSFSLPRKWCVGTNAADPRYSAVRTGISGTHIVSFSVGCSHISFKRSSLGLFAAIRYEEKTARSECKLPASQCPWCSNNRPRYRRP